MRVVLDASVVVAGLIRPRGWTATELARTDVEWYVPRFIFDELEEHLPEFAEIADGSPSTLRRRIESLRARVHVVQDEHVAAHLGDPLARKAAAIDVDDAPYVAALLAVGADYLWTRDHELLEGLPSVAVRFVPRSSA